MEATSHLGVHNVSYFSYFSELRRSLWFVPVIETAVLLLLFFISAVGNLGALIQVARGRRLANTTTTATTTLTTNLFLADLLFVSAVPFIVAVRWTKAWTLGSAACHSVLYFISVSGVVTITTLAAISVERLLTILKMEAAPRAERRWRNAALILIWCASAVAMLPLSVFSRVIPVVSPQQEEVHVCALVWPHVRGEIAWYAVFLALGFLVPGSSIVISYTKILQINRRSKRRLHAGPLRHRARSLCVSKQDHRLFRTLLILMTSFFIMWSPIFIFTLLILMYNSQVRVPITSSAFVWVLTFTMANSALNPLLYSLCQVRRKRRCCSTETTPGRSKATRKKCFAL